MRKRRVVAAIAAAASIIALSACGGGGGGGSSGGGGDSKTLSLFSWENQETMTPLMAAFEKQSGIKIQFSTAPPVAEYISTLQTRILSGTAADVFAIAAENKTNLIKNHAVLDLTNEPFMATIAPFNKQTYSADNHVYGMSLASWGGGIFYNKDLLAKVGATGIPATWDEFLALCTKLKAAGITPYLESVQAMSTPVAAFVGAENVASGNTLDKKIFDGSSSFAATWTTPLTAWSQLWKQGLVTPNVVGLTGDQVRTEFTSGRVAMVTGGPWDVQPIKKAAPKLQFVMGKVPGLPGGQPFLAGAAAPGYAINAKAKNPDGAKKFLAFMATPEAVKMFHDATDAITTTSNFKPSIDPSIRPILEPVRAGQIYLPQIAWQRAEDILNTEATAQLQLLVQGKKTPAEVAAALDQKLKEAPA
jgi:raffinose/stachyose/melibiose transport system substrate-binding protein